MNGFNNLNKKNINYIDSSVSDINGSLGNFSDAFNNAFNNIDEPLPQANVIEIHNQLAFLPINEIVEGLIHENGTQILNTIPSGPNGTFADSAVHSYTMTEDALGNIIDNSDATITDSEDDESMIEEESGETESSNEDLPSENESYNEEEMINQFNLNDPVPEGFKRRFRYSRNEIRTFIAAQPRFMNPIFNNMVYYMGNQFALFIERLTACDLVDVNFIPIELDEEIETSIYVFDRRMFLRNLYFTRVDITLLLERFTTQPAQTHIVDEATSQEWINIKLAFFNASSADIIFVPLNGFVGLNDFTVREMIIEYLHNSGGF